MDRAAKERALHDPPLLERGREIAALEALDARPEPDVAVRRVLVLDATHAFERDGDGDAGASEKQLAREHRAVELTCGEHAKLALRAQAGETSASRARGHRRMIIG